MTPAVADPERMKLGFLVTLIFTTPFLGLTFLLVPSKLTTTTELFVLIVAVLVPLGDHTTRTVFDFEPKAWETTPDPSFSDARNERPPSWVIVSACAKPEGFGATAATFFAGCEYRPKFPWGFFLSS